jgi:hypothetical protein
VAKGASAARNLAFQQCQGDYIQWLRTMCSLLTKLKSS